MENLMEDKVFKELIHNDMIDRKVIYSDVPWHYIAIIFIRTIHKFHLIKYPEGNAKYFLNILNMDNFLKEFSSMDINNEDIILDLDMVRICLGECNVRLFKKYSVEEIINEKYKESDGYMGDDIWVGMTQQFSHIYEKIKKIA